LARQSGLTPLAAMSESKTQPNAPFAAVAPERCQSIQEIREGVDEIDLALLQLLVRRQAYAARFVKIRKETGLPRAPDEKRIAQQIERAKALGLEMGVSPIIVEPLFRTMIAQHVEFERLQYAQSGESSGSNLRK
jgi:isochorismate pyruvate lyase